MKSVLWLKGLALWTLGLASMTAMAGALTGQAVFREKMVLPAQATLTVELVEFTAAGGIGSSVAQTQAPVAGPVTAFTLTYDDAALVLPRRYVLRAKIETQGQVLLHTARDRVFSPQKPPASVQLVLSSSLHGAPPSKKAPPVQPYPDHLPASYSGSLPGAGGAVQWRLNLLPGGQYELRRTYPSRPDPKDFDDLGHWVWDSTRSQLQLTSSNTVRVRFERLDNQTLRQLDRRGRRIDSGVPHTLQRQDSYAPLPLALRGPDWRLVSLPGFELTGQTAKVLPHLVLNRKTNQISGDTGCHRLSGTFTVQADLLQLSAVAGKRRACKTGGELASRFLSVLPLVRSYVIDASGLQLRDASGRVLAQLEARAKAL